MTDTAVLTPAALDRAAAGGLVEQAAALLSDARAILQRDEWNRERYCSALDGHAGGLAGLAGEMDREDRP